MKQCFFCSQNVDDVDYKDVTLLPRFMSLQAKILPAKKTGLCRKHQKRLSRAIKRARYLGLIKYIP
jgi:small subunit ribosomal protein S18